MNLTDLHGRRKSALAGPLPGRAAQFAMAPVHRQDAKLADVKDKKCREAGVLALFVPNGNSGAALVLTIRNDFLKQHAGQVSFPGGRREPGESLEQAALRETHEEIGIHPSHVFVAGSLTSLFVPPSNFCVYPFVATSNSIPDAPTSDEVESLLVAPLDNLLDPSIRRVETRTIRGVDMTVPYFDVDGRKVWGATAMMLAELLAVI